MYELKTEKEKMLSGEFYNADDEELVRDRLKARELTFNFNHTRPSEIKVRNEIMKKLIITKGSFYIEPFFNCDYGYNIKIGEKFYANYDCTLLDVNKIEFGDNVLLGPKVQIYTAMHPINPEERLSGIESSRPIIIGNNVWIGGGTIICPGVTIGDNVTIGAGSVVTKDIPNRVVAVGNPCKVIKEI